MNVREKLLRIQRRYLLLIAAAFLVWGALLLGVMSGMPQEAPTWLFVAATPVFAALLFGMIGINFLVRCPECRGNLGRIGSLSTRPFLSRRRVSNCPFCGLSLDTPTAP